jgi:hypothetical protein
VIRTLTRNWMLLVTCGILNAAISAIYLVMWGTDGPLAFHSWNSTVILLGKLGLAAGVCAIAAGIWRSASGRCWPLAFYGIALGSLGVLEYGFTASRISLLTVALLGMMMAGSMGVLYALLARALGRRFYVAGVISGVLALALLPLALRWIAIRPGAHLDLLWFGACSALSAACTIGIALLLHRGRGGAHPLHLVSTTAH